MALRRQVQNGRTGLRDHADPPAAIWQTVIA
jgi:hypothetical protein